MKAVINVSTNPPIAYILRDVLISVQSKHKKRPALAGLWVFIFQRV